MIVLYTINCPACKVLEAKLDAKGINYKKKESEDAIKALGFATAPLLEIDGTILHFAEAIKYVDNL